MWISEQVPGQKRKFVPHVIEPSLGAILFMTASHFYFVSFQFRFLFVSFPFDGSSEPSIDMHVADL